MSLNPHRKTHWSKSGGKLCEISKFWSFLQLSFLFMYSISIWTFLCLLLFILWLLLWFIVINCAIWSTDHNVVINLSWVEFKICKHVCKLLQLLGDFVPRLSTAEASPLDPTAGLPSHRPSGLYFPMTIDGPATARTLPSTPPTSCLTSEIRVKS